MFCVIFNSIQIDVLSVIVSFRWHLSQFLEAAFNVFLVFALEIRYWNVCDVQNSLFFTHIDSSFTEVLKYTYFLYKLFKFNQLIYSAIGTHHNGFFYQHIEALVSHHLITFDWFWMLFSIMFRCMKLNKKANSWGYSLITMSCRLRLNTVLIIILINVLAIYRI